MLDKTLKFISENPEVIAPIAALILRKLPNKYTDPIVAIVKIILTKKEK